MNIPPCRVLLNKNPANTVQSTGGQYSESVHSNREVIIAASIDQIRMLIGNIL